MEEILASIRRIISEDDAPAEADATEPASAAPADSGASASGAEEDDVLELTEALDEGGRTPAFEHAFEQAPSPTESSGDLDIFAREPEPRREPARRPEPQATADGGLVSEPAAQTAASAFGQLAQSVSMPRDGRSLEDVVREMLRPMLKDWLDQNLPGIVETEVRAEVERIARRSVR